VGGEQVNEFIAEVEPFTLLKGLSKAERKVLALHRIVERLDLFVTESGLPIRVVESLDLGSLESSVTTEILGVNLPMTVAPPPASETSSPPHSGKRRAVEST
jgi:hypothetical protein